MKLGFIGLGRMGSGMAANLVNAGHDVAVYNRTPEKTQKLVALGATAAATVAEACRGEAVVAMLAADGGLPRRMTRPGRAMCRRRCSAGRKRPRLPSCSS